MIVPPQLAEIICNQLKESDHVAAIIGHITDANDGMITVSD